MTKACKTIGDPQFLSDCFAVPSDLTTTSCPMAEDTDVEALEASLTKAIEARQFIKAQELHELIQKRKEELNSSASRALQAEIDAAVARKDFLEAASLQDRLDNLAAEAIAVPEGSSKAETAETSVENRSGIDSSDDDETDTSASPGSKGDAQLEVGSPSSSAEKSRFTVVTARLSDDQGDADVSIWSGEVRECSEKNIWVSRCLLYTSPSPRD